MEIKELSNYTFGKKAKALREEAVKDAFIKPSFMQKTLSSFVDFTIVFVIRFLASSILAVLWYNLKLKHILESTKFDANRTMDFMLKFGIISDFLIFAIIVLFTGGLYYVFLYASKFGATVGCLLFDMKLVRKKTGEKISFLRSFGRYLLCILPVFFIAILGLKYYQHSFDIIFIVLFILSAIWYDLSILLRIPQSVPDVISGTVFVSIKPPKDGKKLKKLY